MKPMLKSTQKQISQRSFNRLVIATTLLFVALCGTFSEMTLSQAKETVNHDSIQAVFTPAVPPTDEPIDPATCSLSSVVCPDEVKSGVVPVAKHAPKASKQPSKAVATVKIANVSKNAKIDASKAICAEKGFTNDCWKVLYAMHMQETTGNCSAVGDGGRSHGCFQIQVKMHGVSKECAKDYECSAKWTLNHLMGHGYPEYAGYAIKRHNGSGPKAEHYYREVRYKISTLN